MKINCLIIFLAIISAIQSLHLRRQHEYNWDTSKQLKNSIQQFLLSNINQFTDSKFREQFKSDLLENDDKKRKLQSISVLNADQLFKILKVTNPDCDNNQDYAIEGEELKCLNIIWKSYVPH